MANGDNEGIDATESTGHRRQIGQPKHSALAGRPLRPLGQLSHRSRCQIRIDENVGEAGTATDRRQPHDRSSRLGADSRQRRNGSRICVGQVYYDFP